MKLMILLGEYAVGPYWPSPPRGGPALSSLAISASLEFSRERRAERQVIGGEMAEWTFAGVLLIGRPRDGRQQDGAALPASPPETTVRAGSVKDIGFLRQAFGKLDSVLRWIQRVGEFSGEPECLLRTSRGRAPTSVLLAEGIWVLRGSEILDLHLWNENLPSLSSRSMGLALANTWRRQLASSLSELVGQLNSDLRFRGIVALRVRTALVPSARLPKLLRVACTFGFAPPSSPGCEPSRWRLGALFDALLLGLLAWPFNPAALRRNGLWRRRCDLWISRHALEARYGRSGGDGKRANPSPCVPPPIPFRSRYICDLADRRAPAGPAEHRVIAAGCLAGAVATPVEVNPWSISIWT